MLNFGEILHGQNRRCARTIRYSSYFVNRPENDAEHMFYNSQYCLVIGLYLERLKVEINWKKLLGGAILHDMEEAVTGDINTRTKYGSKKIGEGLKELSKELVGQMFGSLHGGKGEVNKYIEEQLTSLWSEAKNPYTIEGRVVKLADVMCVISYVAEEIATGNVYMKRLLVETANRLEAMRERQKLEMRLGDPADSTMDQVFSGLIAHVRRLVAEDGAGTLGQYLAELLFKSEEDSRARMVREAGAS